MNLKENVKNYNWKTALKKHGLVGLAYGLSIVGCFVAVDLVHGFNQKPKAQQALPESKTK